MTSFACSYKDHPSLAKLFLPANSQVPTSLTSTGTLVESSATCKSTNYPCPLATTTLNVTDQFIVVPDYLNDLNAMHEAEKVLTVAQRITYAYQIGVVLSGGSVGRAIPNWWFIHEATAAQRAEAFFRTLGLWHETR
tara:strand:+ start:343 stop:753 length:411 start_codon:yes stop_codon:yes gene_type:complete